jgi:hypothetical protein
LEKKDLRAESRIPKLEVGGSNPLARFLVDSLLFSRLRMVRMMRARSPTIPLQS